MRNTGSSELDYPEERFRLYQLTSLAARNRPDIEGNLFRRLPARPAPDISILRPLNRECNRSCRGNPEVPMAFPITLGSLVIGAIRREIQPTLDGAKASIPIDQ